jgi:transcription initiation factor TFIIIB Brf1 subunit/transcription initiation factor TFIIB
MAEFLLFDQAMSKYNKVTSQKSNSMSNSNECQHTNTIVDGNIIVCSECYKEIKKNIMHEREWRYYENKSSDPTRVQVRKSDDKNIFKDVENMDFSEKIISVANDIYIKITDGKIYRGSSRKKIVLGCVYNAYKIEEKPQQVDDLVKLFGLSRKNGYEGVKIVSSNIPNDTVPVISAIHIIDNIMDEFRAKQEHKDEVHKMYKYIENRSSKLNRARPKSVACGLVYFWICLRKKNINIKEFAKKTKLSELTILKMAKEIEIILKKPGVV